MLKPLRVAAFLLVLPPTVLLSACGSSKTASTKTTASAISTGSTASTTGTGSTGATHTGTSASAQTGRQGKSSGQTHRATPTTPAPKVTHSTPENTEQAETEAEARRQRERELSENKASTPTLDAVERQLPPSRRIPKALQGKFVSLCERAKGSTRSCECIVAKQELKINFERGRLVAELLALELAFVNQHASLADLRRHRVPVPSEILRVVRAC